MSDNANPPATPAAQGPRPMDSGSDPTPAGAADRGPGPRQVRRRVSLPKAATSRLKAWMVEHIHHPYPTENQKVEMASRFGLTMNQVNNWFINARRRFLRKYLETHPRALDNNDMYKKGKKRNSEDANTLQWPAEPGRNARALGPLMSLQQPPPPPSTSHWVASKQARAAQGAIAAHSFALAQAHAQAAGALPTKRRRTQSWPAPPQSWAAATPPAAMPQAIAARLSFGSSSGSPPGTSPPVLVLPGANPVASMSSAAAASLMLSLGIVPGPWPGLAPSTTAAPAVMFGALPGGVSAPFSTAVSPSTVRPGWPTLVVRPAANEDSEDEGAGTCG